jgi:hypothetical protein
MEMEPCEICTVACVAAQGENKKGPLSYPSPQAPLSRYAGYLYSNIFSFLGYLCFVRKTFHPFES